jgi:hypothetical protein
MPIKVQLVFENDAGRPAVVSPVKVAAELDPAALL